MKKVMNQQETGSSVINFKYPTFSDTRFKAYILQSTEKRKAD